MNDSSPNSGFDPYESVIADQADQAGQPIDSYPFSGDHDATHHTEKEKQAKSHRIAGIYNLAHQAFLRVDIDSLNNDADAPADRNRLPKPE